jgi:hypothetical protein
MEVCVQKAKSGLENEEDSGSARTVRYMRWSTLVTWSDVGNDLFVLDTLGKHGEVAKSR